MYSISLIAFIILLGLYTVNYIIKRRKETLIRKSSMRDISRMSGEEFEVYLKTIFKKLGYRVELTDITGDFGADLILIKDNQKIVVQAKRYKGSVGIKAVQEVLGAKSFYSANEAWVITNSYYTKSAKQLAEKSSVRLLNKEGVIDLAQQANVKTINRNEHSDIKCPLCQSEMIIKKGKHGQFYGCVSFPKCRGTQTF